MNKGKKANISLKCHRYNHQNNSAVEVDILNASTKHVIYNKLYQLIVRIPSDEVDLFFSIVLKGEVNNKNS